jgi:S-adenosylhomocysteine hydrolase
MRATDVTIGGKPALLCGYSIVGKGCAFAWIWGPAIITEFVLICAGQPCMEDFQVITLDYVEIAGKGEFLFLATM